MRVSSFERFALRLLATILGIILAVVGGVIAYRALFLEPRAAIVITSDEIREVPNYTKVIGGTVLFIGGASLAIYAATRRLK